MEGTQYVDELRYLRLTKERVDDWRARHTGEAPDRDTLGNIERGSRWEIAQAPTEGPVEVMTGDARVQQHEDFVDLSVELWRLEFQIANGRPPSAAEADAASGPFESTALLAEEADASLPPLDGPPDPPVAGDSLQVAVDKYSRLYRMVRHAPPDIDGFASAWENDLPTDVPDLVAEAQARLDGVQGPLPYDKPYELAHALHDRLRDWRWLHDGNAPDAETLIVIEVEVRQEIDRAAHDRPLPDLTSQQMAARSDDFVTWSMETWRTEFEARSGRVPTVAETAAAFADIDFEAIDTWRPGRYATGRPAVATEVVKTIEEGARQASFSEVPPAETETAAIDYRIGAEDAGSGRRAAVPGVGVGVGAIIVAAAVVAAIMFGGVLGGKVAVAPSASAPATPSTALETPSTIEASTSSKPVAGNSPSAGAPSAAPGGIVSISGMMMSDSRVTDKCSAPSGTKYVGARYLYSFVLQLALPGAQFPPLSAYASLIGRTATVTLVGSHDAGTYTTKVVVFFDHVQIIVDGHKCPNNLPRSAFGNLTIDGLTLRPGVGTGFEADLP